MAKSIGVKIPKKKPRAKVNRKTGFADPVWTGWERWSGEKFHREVDRLKFMYYNQVDPKDLMPSVYHWMKENGYTPKQIKAAKAVWISPNVAIQCKLLATGMPAHNPKHAEYWESLPGTGDKLKPVTDFIKQHVDQSVEAGMSKVAEVEAKEKAAAKKYTPSIREVMFDAACAMSEGIDDVVEDFVRTNDPAVVADFDPYAILVKVQAKANHARIIRKQYEGEFEEMTLVNNIPSATQLKKMTEREQDEWEQIKEGYAHFTAKQKKAALELFKKIIDACDMIINTQKVTRAPRKVKAKSPEQLVSKLKFKVNDTTYAITSVPPAQIIGAVAMVVFNAKTRKLGIYIAADEVGFGVKGSTLTNFNETTSVQKTVRKPDEVLGKFKKTTKPKTLKEFEMIKTTETKMNGRFNTDTVIISVFK
jgi:rubrerythrin